MLRTSPSTKMLIGVALIWLALLFSIILSPAFYGISIEEFLTSRDPQVIGHAKVVRRLVHPYASLASLVFLFAGIYLAYNASREIDQAGGLREGSARRR